MKRLSLHEWMPMLPWPVCPLAGHATLGQNVVVGSMLVLRVALGNVPRGICLDPHFHCKRTIPRLSVELPNNRLLVSIALLMIAVAFFRFASLDKLSSSTAILSLFAVQSFARGMLQS